MKGRRARGKSRTLSSTVIPVAAAMVLLMPLVSPAHAADAQKPPHASPHAATPGGFGAVEAAGLRWLHLSSRHGDLPVPSTSRQQTAAVVADLDRDGVNDFVLGFREKGPALVWYRRTGEVGKGDRSNLWGRGSRPGDKACKKGRGNANRNHAQRQRSVLRIRTSACHAAFSEDKRAGDSGPRSSPIGRARRKL